MSTWQACGQTGARCAVCAALRSGRPNCPTPKSLPPRPMRWRRCATRSRPWLRRCAIRSRPPRKTPPRRRHLPRRLRPKSLTLPRSPRPIARRRNRPSTHRPPDPTRRRARIARRARPRSKRNRRRLPPPISMRTARQAKRQRTKARRRTTNRSRTSKPLPPDAIGSAPSAKACIGRCRACNPASWR